MHLVDNRAHPPVGSGLIASPPLFLPPCQVDRRWQRLRRLPADYASRLPPTSVGPKLHALRQAIATNQVRHLGSIPVLQGGSAEKHRKAVD
jgi:hypothetical protein